MSSSMFKEHSSQQERLHILLNEARQRYIDRNPGSKKLHEEALENLPGGNTRSILHADPFPICLQRGFGNRLVDVDGHEYLDFVGDMTAGVYGHSHPVIQEALISTMREKGLNLGGTSAEENQFASIIRHRIPSIQKLRFCNSGTEANLYALSIARHFTGLSKVIVFEGAYHGGVLTFAHGVAANNVDKQDWILAKYNDVKKVKKLLAENKGRVAAVLVEGMQGAGGCIPGSAEFLHAIQDSAKENGIIFILDEVMTFRLAPGGVQSKILHPQLGIALNPDLTTLGKIIAGGMTIGAFGGRADLLSVYDPRISMVQHSGTFNNNSLAMVIGCKALSIIYTPEICIELNKLGDMFRERLQLLAKEKKMKVTGVGSVCNIHFVRTIAHEICGIEDITVEPGSSETVLKDLLCFHALESGFWISRRGMLSLVIGTTKEETDGFVEMIQRFLSEHQEFVGS
ncbi:acetylornithine aminotransferase [Glonium stellatum]|uniref:Acetylornithine aminotransferase n=1 Tax=Glonium stellatum TaxID=574774 RepID=A0A8E2FBD0_9PEZI|nr:acetylornithine aminotransferase [Glonium stellatum]